MIKAGNYSINDNGFAVSVERMGGTAREVLVLELGGGISEEALTALCTGPIEVLDEDGATVRTHTGPFRVVSHSLRLARASEAGDVAALTARVSSLEAELTQERSEKHSALDSLAALTEKFNSLKEQITASTGGGIPGGLGNLGDKLGAAEKETADETGGAQQ